MEPQEIPSSIIKDVAGRCSEIDHHQASVQVHEHASVMDTSGQERDLDNHWGDMADANDGQRMSRVVEDINPEYARFNAETDCKITHNLCSATDVGSSGKVRKVDSRSESLQQYDDDDLKAERDSYVFDWEEVDDVVVYAWQWSTRSGWQDYSPDVSEVLSEAMHMGRPSCVMSIGGVEYEADLTRMVQRPVGSGFGRERKIRIKPQVDEPVRQRFLSAADKALLRQIVHPLMGRMQDAAFGFCDNLPNTMEDEPGSDILGDVWMLAKRIAEDIQKAMKCNAPCCTLTIHQRHSPETVMASISLGIYLSGLDFPLLFAIFSNKGIQDVSLLQEAWHWWQTEAKHKLQTEEVPTFRMHNGSYAWIHGDNSSTSRFERLAGAIMTLRCGLSLASTPNAVRGTRFLQFRDGEPRDESHHHHQKVRISHSSVTVLQASVEQARKRRRVVAINAASAYQVGGGFLSGGRHALEEAMCMQTTLYLSLLEAACQANRCNLRDTHGRRIHIPEDGVIFSPDVMAFRSSTLQGYSPMDDSSMICLDAVVSVAMPNRNIRLRDSPVDYRQGREYDELIEQKWFAALDGVARANAQVLVVPDVGCGVFQNDPTKVGRALGYALSHSQTELSEVIVTGSRDFAAAVHSALFGMDLRATSQEECSMMIDQGLQAAADSCVSAQHCSEDACDQAAKIDPAVRTSTDTNLLVGASCDADVPQCNFGRNCVLDDRMASPSTKQEAKEVQNDVNNDEFACVTSEPRVHTTPAQSDQKDVFSSSLQEEETHIRTQLLQDSANREIDKSLSMIADDQNGEVIGVDIAAGQSHVEEIQVEHGDAKVQDRDACETQSILSHDDAIQLDDTVAQVDQKHLTSMSQARKQQVEKEIHHAIDKRDTAHMQLCLGSAREVGISQLLINTLVMHIDENNEIVAELENAAESRDLECLKLAIQHATKVGWDGKQLHSAKQQLNYIETKHSGLRRAISGAFASNDVLTMRSAIQEARMLGLSGRELEDAEMRLVKLEELQAAASQHIRNAILANEYVALSQAVTAAQTVGVAGHELATALKKLDALAREKKLTLDAIWAAFRRQDLAAMRTQFQHAQRLGFEKKDRKRIEWQMRTLEVQQKIREGMEPALQSKDINAVCTLLRQSNRAGFGAADILACVNTQASWMELLKRALDVGHVSKLGEANQDVWKAAANDYVQFAMQSADVPLICNAVQVDTLFASSSLSHQQLVAKLKTVVQDMVNKTYSSVWTHDRERRASKYGLDGTKVPAKYLVSSVKPIYCAAARSKYVHWKRRIVDGKGVTEVHKTISNEWGSSLDGKSNEWLLFHGTSIEKADKIAKQGFLLTGADGKAACGKGLYFTESPTKADEYTCPDASGQRSLLICQVLGGHVKYTDKKDPKADPDLTDLSGKGFHSVLNDRVKCSNTYKEFFVPEECQVIPHCIVKYQHSA